MSLKGSTKIALATAGLALVLSLSTVPGKPSMDDALLADHKPHPHTMASECEAEQQGAQWVDHVSWFSWIAGKSSSYQFHFLDLLELLYGRGE